MGNSNHFLTAHACDSIRALPFSLHDLNSRATVSADSTKLIFAGTAVEGKQRAVSLLSETALLSLTPEDKQVDSLCYGLLSLGESQQLHLYSVPTQVPHAMKDTLMANALGMVLLLDNARPDPLQDLQDYLVQFQSLIVNTTLIIGLVNSEQGNASLADYHHVLNEQGYILPVFEVDMHQEHDIEIMMSALLHILAL